MLHRVCASTSIALALFVAVEASAAQPQRTFVASYGNDGWPCSLPQPCRGFQAAIAAVATDGEVIVLDSAGYGTAFIDKSVSIIVPPGIYGGVSVPLLSVAGIRVAGAAIDVTLKGLSINGQGGTLGVWFNQGANLYIEGCTISHLTGDGIVVDNPAKVTIVNTTIIGNSGNGVHLSFGASATITGARIERNISGGIWLQGGSSTIERTTVARNGSHGIFLEQTNAGQARLSIDASVITDHAIGAGVSWLATGDGAVAELDIARSTVARNYQGLYAEGSSGGSALGSVTGNQVANNGNGLVARGNTTRVRATGNTLVRSIGSGFLQFLGGTIHTPGNNIVRENGTDDGGHTADTFL